MRTVCTEVGQIALVSRDASVAEDLRKQDVTQDQEGDASFHER
jgi:hypothetical protein